MPEESTFTVEAPDGSVDEVTLPTGLVSLFNEADDPPAQVVGDIVQMAFTQRAHAIVHHSEGAVDEEISDIEDHALSLFEARFDESFGDLTGHSH